MKNNLVIVDNGMVNHHFILQATEQSLYHRYNFHRLNAENYEVCDPVQLNLAKQSSYKNVDVALHQVETVSYIDRTKKELGTSFRTTVSGDLCE